MGRDSYCARLFLLGLIGLDRLIQRDYEFLQVTYFVIFFM
jgi:hypothetical protein